MVEFDIFGHDLHKGMSGIVQVRIFDEERIDGESFADGNVILGCQAALSIKLFQNFSESQQEDELTLL